MNKSYEVICCDTVDEVEAEVATAINKGFEPVGGILYVDPSDRPYFCQAVWRDPSKVRQRPTGIRKASSI